MSTLTVYCSQPANPQMATFLLALGLAQGATVRPLAALPAPDPLRRQALRVERGELRETIAQVQHDLDRFAFGDWQPDAGRENGLRFELDALQTRLKGVEAVLGSTEKGGVDNG